MLFERTLSVFRLLTLLAAVIGAVVVADSYIKALDNGRYVPQAEIAVLDTRTGVLYVPQGSGGAVARDLIAESRSR